MCYEIMNMSGWSMRNTGRDQGAQDHPTQEVITKGHVKGKICSR